MVVERTDANFAPTLMSLCMEPVSVENLEASMKVVTGFLQVLSEAVRVQNQDE